MKKLIMFSVLFCWCSNVYGQKSITDTIDITSTTIVFYSGLSPIWLDFIELYELYEIQCFNDSTLIISAGSSTNYSTPTTIDSLGRKVIDLTETFFINADYVIKKEWIHVQPSFIGFMQYLKEQL